MHQDDERRNRILATASDWLTRLRGSGDSQTLSEFVAWLRENPEHAKAIGFCARPERGVAVKDLCRRHGFSEASYYLWRSKFGGMDVSDVKRLKALELENARLKKLLAESMLENEVTREALRKKW